MRIPQGRATMDRLPSLPFSENATLGPELILVG